MVSTPSTQRARIVVGSPRSEGHEYDATMVARALRDAGHEVIYAGLHQTPEQIVATAIQEDADLIGVATDAGPGPALAAELSFLLAERDASDIGVVAGSAAEIRRWVAENFAD